MKQCSRRSWVSAVGLVALAGSVSLSVAVPAFAQANRPAVTAGWQDGFFVGSDDGAYRVTIGTMMQADGRFDVDDPPATTSTFALRKIRPVMTGRVARFFDMRLVPDFAGGTVVLQDAYLDARFSDAVRVRVGKDKTPFGYELLIGDPYVMLTERSLASALVPNRDVGVQVLGDLKPGRVTYSAGVMNGVPDGASSTSDVDSNGGKTVVGRVVVHPFTTRGHVLDGFGLHLGASRGHEEGALPSFRTSIGQTWFAYDRATTASGLHTRLTPAALYYVKAFGLFAEYVRSVQEVRRTSVVEVENHGWDVTAAYVLTGEAVTERGVRPAHPFDPTHHQWGAVQVLGRVSALTVDSGAFAGGRTGAVAATTSSRTAHQYSVGLNWYPAAVIKYYAEYEHTTFDGGLATRPAENAVMVRAQVAF